MEEQEAIGWGERGGGRVLGSAPPALFNAPSSLESHLHFN